MTTDETGSTNGAGAPPSLMSSLRGTDPAQAAEALREALRHDPERLDLVHALAVVELRRGEPDLAHALAAGGISQARMRRDATSGMLVPQLLLVRASASEDRYDPTDAEAAYREILDHEPENPRGQQGLGYLLLAWGRVSEGLGCFHAYLDQAVDEPNYLEATRAVVRSIEDLIVRDIHPLMFLQAHRGAYVEFFNDTAQKMAGEGWIAEAARMRRTDDGRVVNSIPDGAQPYAGVRVDLVDPSTGQGGQIGDKPMVVALKEFESVSQAPVLSTWPPHEHPFPLWVSSRCPWNHLSIQIRMAEDADFSALDATIGDWYSAGFDGSFGSSEAGRLHEITPPRPIGRGRVVYHVDCGRAELSCVPDLMRRLAVLHSSQAIEGVLLGEGFVPMGRE